MRFGEIFGCIVCQPMQLVMSFMLDDLAIFRYLFFEEVHVAKHGISLVLCVASAHAQFVRANLVIKSHFGIRDVIFLLYIWGEIQRKCFRVLLWKCGSFQYLGAAEYISLALTMRYACVSMQADTPYQSECGVSVVYRERFFHNLHRVDDMSSTLFRTVYCWYGAQPTHTVY